MDWNSIRSKTAEHVWLTLVGIAVVASISMAVVYVSSQESKSFVDRALGVSYDVPAWLILIYALGIVLISFMIGWRWPREQRKKKQYRPIEFTEVTSDWLFRIKISHEKWLDTDPRQWPSYFPGNVIEGPYHAANQCRGILWQSDSNYGEQILSKNCPKCGENSFRDKMSLSELHKEVLQALQSHCRNHGPRIQPGAKIKLWGNDG
jgi:hypothetical protein